MVYMKILKRNQIIVTVIALMLVAAGYLNFANQNNVSIIKMEKLSGIRQKTSKSRKNNTYIHTWSFFRLQKFIEYNETKNR